jgi:hypothetical protein
MQTKIQQHFGGFFHQINVPHPVLRIGFRIHMFLGLLELDPLV